MQNPPQDPTDLELEADSRDFGSIQIGEVLDGKYEITGRIASGGMGTIFRARHRELDTDVAIKVLHPRYAAEQEGMRRFQREARIISGLRHPNILTVNAFGSVNGLVYMVMELVHGESLGQLIRDRGPLPVNEAIPIFLQICDAMQFAHDSEVFHRDLKPDNVIVVTQHDGTKSVKLIDFGLAKLLEGVEGQRLTKTGEVLGDPSYMSPEQAQGRNLDRRSDVYSFGCLMYEVLTGERPFQADSPVAVLYKQISEDPAPFAQSRDLPPSLETITFTAMAKDLDQRYDSFAEVKDVLQQVAANPAVVLQASYYKRRNRGPVSRRQARLALYCGGALAVALVALFVHLSRFQWQSDIHGQPSAVVVSFPSTPGGLLTMAWDYLYFGDYDKALMLLREADRRYKEDPRTFPDLRQVLRMKLDLASCLRHFEQFDAANKSLREALPIAARIDRLDEASVLLVLSRNSEDLGNWKEALAYALAGTTILDSIPEEKYLRRQRVTLGLWRQAAVSYSSQGDRTNADKSWVRVLQTVKILNTLGDFDQHACFEYAGYLYEGRRFADALKVTDDLLESSLYKQSPIPQESERLLCELRGDIMLKLGRLGEAASEYNRALSFAHGVASDRDPQYFEKQLQYKRAICFYHAHKRVLGDDAYQAAENIAIVTPAKLDLLRGQCRKVRDLMGPP